MQVPNKIQYILVTGNLCTKEQAEYFRSLCSEVHITKGDFDDVRFARLNAAHFLLCASVLTRSLIVLRFIKVNLNLPEEKVITIGNFKLGLVHGHQVRIFPLKYLPFDET